MDKDQLKSKLSEFIAGCHKKGYSIDNVCVIEAYPGDSSTSFTLQIKEPWTQEMTCSDTLDMLFDVLWDTTDVETRKHIFAIQIMDEDEALQCEGYQPLDKKAS